MSSVYKTFPCRYLRCLLAEVEVGARFVIVLEGSLAGKIKEKEVKLGRGNYLEDEVGIGMTRGALRQVMMG